MEYVPERYLNLQQRSISDNMFVPKYTSLRQYVEEHLSHLYNAHRCSGVDLQCASLIHSACLLDSRIHPRTTSEVRIAVERYPVQAASTQMCFVLPPDIGNMWIC